MAISFSKVSYKQYKEDYQKCFGTEIEEKYIQESYDNIKLPRRATTGSAGYDFFSPISFRIESGESILIPSGIRVFMPEGIVLLVYPRSSLGFKYRMQLDNGVGVLDSDYYYAPNEGHIMFKFTNDSKYENTLTVPAGMAMAQGIFTTYYITVDDDTTEKRVGGIGSTTNKE